MSEVAPYVDPDVFQQERREIFATAWQVVSDVAALHRPGDYVCANLAGFAALVICDDKGTLQAFQNVCRHQRLPILDNGVGHCDVNVRCRYHGWTYDFAGTRIHAPDAVRPDDFGTTDYRLDTVALTKWRGLAVVNFDADPPPHAIAFAAIDAQLEGYASKPRFLARDVVPVFANWKAIVDEIVAGDERPLPSGQSEQQSGTLVRKADGELWVWRAPTLGLHATPQTLLVLQVVPRTFLKSEIHWWLLGLEATPEAAAEEASRRATAGAEGVKRLAEQRQATIKTAETLPALSDQVAAATLRSSRHAV